MVNGMSLTKTTIYDSTTWQTILADLPNGHVLQSWLWGEFKSRWGWQPERLLWREKGQPVAAAQILARPIPYTPWLFLYVAKGPIFDYENSFRLAQVAAELERYAIQKNALFIKVDPDIPLRYGETSPADPLTTTGQASLDILKRRGWQFSPEQIQFRNTVIIDLTPSEEDLLAAMKSKWRYNIRLAGRRGVTIQPGTLADLPAFYDMYAETAARDGFLIRPATYYRDGWSTFMSHHQAELLLAHVEGEVVAGLMLFFSQQTAWYLYGASTDQHRNLMPNHLLQWQAIRRAKARGCRWYDMWGAPDRFDEDDPMWGVYRFKQGFAGQVMQGLGAWDYPVKPRLYHLFTIALPRLRAWWRRARRQ